MSGFRQLPLISCGRAAKAMGMFLHENTKSGSCQLKNHLWNAGGMKDLIVVIKSSEVNLAQARRVAYHRCQLGPVARAATLPSPSDAITLFIVLDCLELEKKSEEKVFRFHFKLIRCFI
jgi:hypothetical protein